MGLGLSTFFGVACAPLVVRDYLGWRGAFHAWRDFGRRNGFSFSGKFVLSRRWKLEGAIEGVRFRALATTGRTEVTTDPIIDSQVRVEAKGLLAGTSSIEVPGMDPAVVLQAGPLLLAGLNHGVRDDIARAAKAGVVARHGHASFRRDKRIRESEHPIETIVVGVVALTKAFPVRSLVEE